MKPTHVLACLAAFLFGLELSHVNIGSVLHVQDFPAPSLGLVGPFAPNEILKDNVHILFKYKINGSETTNVEDGGQSLLLIDKYAEAWHAYSSEDDDSNYSLADKPFANLGAARPLGFMKDAHGNVIVCDTNQGLVSLEPDGRVVLLASRVSASSPIDPDSYIQFANNLDISQSAEGTIFFTDSVQLPAAVEHAPGERPYFEPMSTVMDTLVTGSKTGRLLAFYPQNGTVHVLAKGFWFANGVALSGDESFVAVAETAGFRIHRFWLKGPKAGTMDILIERLPGFVDNMVRAADGSFWVALPAPRTMQAYLLKSKILRALLRYVSPIQLRAAPWGAIMKVSPDGEVLRFLMDTKGSRVSSITDVQEHKLADGRTRLFMGSLLQPYVSCIDIQDDAR
ncbi:strictosidine synthase [Dunaliella salina]|uniref:Strictosidine synthase n=1 Tax=Dunaliella salina TaxID=3046 RepID=A0ABQ7G5J6_DUNSA|nr:strictosidine synthase [Dunaliella salina]|eukprot:KAF5829857.1 strictosidine synthase [Dunaliella salina]